MQKKIIALAVAGLVSAPAFAQSNVTVYGVAGAYFLQSKTQATTNGATAAAVSVNTINTDGESGSRIGFRGTEDLGGGLKANFTIESALAMDAAGLTTASGVQGLGNRQAFVGLSGNWGSFSLGRQYSAEFWHMAAKADIWGYADWSALLAAGMAVNTRVSNSWQLATPSMGGFSGRMTYGLSEGAAAPKDAGQSTGINLDYANGPMWVGLGYMKVNADYLVGTTVNGSSNSWTSLGASYDFGMGKVSGSFANRTTGATATAASFKTSQWQIGGSFKVGGNGSIIAQFGNSNSKAAADTDAKTWAIGYQHVMSKRTNLVIGAANTDQSGVNATNATGVTDTRRYFGGVRHTF